MSVRKWLACGAIVAMGSLGAPRAASAGWVATPFVGWNLGGSADVTGNGGAAFNNKFEKKIDYGISLASLGRGPLGFELDFGYSPNFFETGTASDNEFAFTNSSNAVSLMGNVLVAPSMGGRHGAIRPYVVGGVGLLRTNVQDAGQAFSVNTKDDFGLDIGGGVMGFFSKTVGVRGDIRYFRGFNGSSTNVTGLGLSDFRYWRASLGASFRF